ncbi:LacI family DNA-binding transcriptional regulator [Bacillus taeanensis]|uniref:LacI family transcriptional regulator n=1 Tax=Bacillus taeanensis TaxID=273032 RepID=A0A366XZ98_9BACI|nr:LacI family DNA-binding transcriptional regulator [Bacillus taeanensis]RBW70888.1 LacI family transcriptional regulator [Bacillus taeanensis]
MVTIADVAKLAGLSRATVSRVINDYPYVAEEKKQRVIEAMNELGYSPNSSAQRLRTQKTNTIAVLVPRLVNPFFAYLVEGIEFIAMENDLQLLICQTKSDKDKEIKFLNLLKTKQVDGLIMTSIENEWEVVQSYLQYGPILLCNEYHPKAEVPMIGLNQEHGSYLGTRHLIERGHKKIAFCFGGTNSSLGEDREKGYLRALQEFGLKSKDEWYYYKDYSIEDGKKALRKFMSLKERPTAVFTGSDEMAAGMLQEAKKYGLEIPRDLALLGFDDQPIASLLDPALTTIHQPAVEIGKKAMNVMSDMLQKKVSWQTKQLYELPIELIVREST